MYYKCCYLLFLDLAKAILSLLIACIKGKIKVTMGLSVLSDLVSTVFQIHFYVIFVIKQKLHKQLIYLNYSQSV